MASNSFVVLFDYDSMIYKAIWKITQSDDYKTTDYPNTGLIRKWFREERTREWMEIEIINLTINRLEQMGNTIFKDIEDTGIEIYGIEYFLTSCPNSIRKEQSPIYKANRKPNKWVKMVRKELLRMGFASVDDKWEADDMIKDRAIELGQTSCVICSIDKDLKQISGIHFDYYRPQLNNPDGSPQLDENGFRKVAPCRGLDIVSEKDADKFFWVQMLMGDNGDNIKGIPRLGKEKAKKILSRSRNYENTVKLVYTSYAKKSGKDWVYVFGEEEGIKQFELHRLLIGLGVKYRP